MLRNQSIPAPSDTLPIELVSTPIDWSAYMFEIEPSVSLAWIGCMAVYLFTLFLIQESMECWYAD